MFLGNLSSKLNSKISPNSNDNFCSISTPTRFKNFPIANLKKYKKWQSGAQSIPQSRRVQKSVLPQRNVRGVAYSDASVSGYENNKKEGNDDFANLQEEIEALGICCSNNDISIGEYTRLMCPKCKGGLSMENSLSFHIPLKKNFVLWRCFNFECGWSGHKMFNTTKSNQLSSKFEPLSDIVVEYFAKRKISKTTLQRNHVMQMSSGQPGTQNFQIIIAFTYRHNGMIIGCKYRTLEKKRFWQEKGTHKALYGLDDASERTDIIIVEGEMDKLSLEEAGYTNCVSVPNGAPMTVGSEDTNRFAYLWSCKELLEKKASRIVLATDSDLPGQALAEALARVLGRERCWKVCWPKKDEISSYKDANDVLVNLGVEALKEVIECAVPYEMQNLN